MIAVAEIEAVRKAADLWRIIPDLAAVGRLRVRRCPFHEEKTGSFYVWPDHYHCFGCGAHGDAIDWLMQAERLSFHEAVARLGGDIAADIALPEPKTAPPRLPASDPHMAAIARGIWREGVAPAGTLVEDYLATRRLSLPDEPVIRFHPACPCGPDRMPAMISLMTDPATGEPRGIHRTFLHPDGSGNVSKMMLGPAGVVRLAEQITAGLGLAEGIESALAVSQRIGWGPVWAAGSAGGIAKFPVLIETTPNIFVDRDDTGVGLNAARECAERWAAAGREVLIHHPPDGTDWDKATREDVL
jgi:hypothetical protein